MNRSGGQKKVALLALLVLLLGACATERGKTYTVDGKRYCDYRGVWRNKWWQHYERGQSCASGGFWNEAIGSYKAAFAAARGHRDRWYVNTYGVNFIDDYFPHRELGIAYYRVGRHEEAQEELVRSLEMTPSAKAKFYLNEVRRHLISQKQSDRTAPRIVIDRPLDGELTNELTVAVTGYAEDDTFVESLVVNGQEIFIELAETRRHFTQDIQLRDGANRITVAATDLAGRQTQQHVTVHLDRRGPSLSLQSVRRLQSPSQGVRVRGSLLDRSNIERFKLAGRRISLSPEGGAFDEVIDIQPQVTSLAFEAEDAAGNVTRGTFVVASASDTTINRIRKGKRQLPGLFRRAALPSPFSSRDPEPAYFMLAQQPDRRRRREKERPLIVFTHRDAVDGIGDCQTQVPIVVYEDRAILEIKVTDGSGITKVAIDGKPLPHREGRQLFFTEIVPLQLETTNRFHIEAVDVWDNTTECEISVTHEIRKIRRIAYRLKVIQEPLIKKTSICQATPLTAFADDFLLEHLKVAKRFNIILGPKSDKSEKVDGLIRGKRCEGKIEENVSYFQAFAEFVEVDGNGYESPDTNTIIESVYDEELTPQRVEKLMKVLAFKLLRHFPLEEGNITETRGLNVVTDLSKVHQIRPRMKLIVYREAQAQSQGDRTDSDQKVLGEAQIIDVFAQSSEARLLSARASKEVQRHDKVITK